MRKIRIKYKGWVYEFSVDAVARNRAAHYAEEEYGGDVARSLKEDTLPLFEDDREVLDWAQNNMDADEVKLQMVSHPEPPNHSSVWSKGTWEVVD